MTSEFSPASEPTRHPDPDPDTAAPADSAAGEIPSPAADDRAADDRAAEWEDRAKRALAELDNYRKRVAREKADGLRYANRNLLAELIPILDNFEMGLQAAERDGADTVIAQGLGMVYKQLRDFLESNGVEEIAAEGQPFDPNRHEAVSAVASADVPDGCVAHVLRKGYRLHDQLLRAASVIVSKGPADEAPAARHEDVGGGGE